ncbi:cysteine--tRNA ligase [Lactococcus hodotermopsidis]|uniref:Cysteine--tRNA ligase n=1 Tax=Pseudolactococcus hodotermopsidis TaxID=2709157 RepID=A0A6A0BED1_9LACT|nr:cysteine--tRNA ligase [Lactococcus hodotermopsidis]GFH42187.1 cysteine--tRNA ligase [Lactococcus hodotermopsidis]
MIRLYNTLTREKEIFVPLEAGKVKMYVCGPTVYNYIHIGNARSVVVFDTIRKYFEYRGFEVNFVSNFTDVDDKIIAAAKLAGISVEVLVEKFIAAFYADTKNLGVAPATANPRVLEFIPQIIDFIQVLIDKGFAYAANGDVFFRVKKFADYGKLANKNLDELAAGASGRTEADELAKESPLDFALWKASKPDDLSWESPWGAGRPGWHIECSVMATEILGNTIDIHGGGADLEFPHHTNEIAQSESKTGQKFANYWLHNGFVTAADGEKMSKSLGNFKTVHEMLAGFDGQILRFFLVSQHYRRPLAFSEDTIKDAENNFAKIKNAYEKLSYALDKNPLEKDEKIDDFRQDFIEQMDDDFNIANALTVFYEFIKYVNLGHFSKEARRFFDEVLTIIGVSFANEILGAEIEKLIEARQIAREMRDYVQADEIRNLLKAQGISLLDTPDGVRWTRD